MDQHPWAALGHRTCRFAVGVVTCQQKQRERCPTWWTNAYDRMCCIEESDTGSYDWSAWLGSDGLAANRWVATGSFDWQHRVRQDSQKVWEHNRLRGLYTTPPQTAHIILSGGCETNRPRLYKGSTFSADGTDASLSTELHMHDPVVDITPTATDEFCGDGLRIQTVDRFPSEELSEYSVSRSRSHEMKHNVVENVDNLVFVHFSHCSLVIIVSLLTVTVIELH